MRKPITNLAKIISDGVNAIHNCEHPLAKLWRIILFRNGLSPQEWQIYLTRWRDKTHKPVAGKGKALQKGNINAALCRGSTFSWNTFMRALMILEYTHFTIDKITFHRGNDEKRSLTLENLTVHIKEYGDDNEEHKE